MSVQSNVLSLRTASVLMLFGLTASSSLRADTYSQASVATIGDMSSETIATTPANRARTTLGIGEEVRCSLDPSTWVDKDCNITTGRIEDDTIGMYVWVCAGAGTVDPSGMTDRASTTLTADMLPGDVWVMVTVYDSGGMYVDNGVTKTKPFRVILPDGMTVSLAFDAGFFIPGTNQIGARTVFTDQVTPTSVSFYKANFREHFEDQTFDNWPDGSWSFIGACDLPFGVGFDNIYSDAIVDGPTSKWHLWNGQDWEDYAYTVHWVNQVNTAVWWADIQDMTSTTFFSASDFTTTHTLNGVSGHPQGPWE